MSFLRLHKNHLQSRNAGLDQETAFESSVDVAIGLKVLPLALTHTDINKMKQYLRRCGVHRWINRLGAGSAPSPWYELLPH